MPETVSTPSPSPPSLPSPPAPTLLELGVAFAVIALCGFGGVLAWSRRMLVEERRWMTPEEFNDAYALCQFLPGPMSSTSRSSSAGGFEERSDRRSRCWG